jgi:hypothetical protein
VLLVLAQLQLQLQVELPVAALHYANDLDCLVHEPSV